jgi:hypothetical protein
MGFAGTIKINFDFNLGFKGVALDGGSAFCHWLALHF